MNSDPSFVQLVVVGAIALFPPINPVGTAFIVEPYLKPLRPAARRRISLKIALYALGVCLTALLVGSELFRLFGISIGAVRIAGGILICKMGWTELANDGASDEKTPDLEPDLGSEKRVERMAFFPLAFPTTTGAGTISVLLALGAHTSSKIDLEYFRHTGALALSALVMCILVFVCYNYEPVLLRRLGKQGEQVVSRLSAFMMFCVGIQILVDGIRMTFLATN